MITASTSSRLTAEAMPAPSALIARSISFFAIGSPCSSARSQMPLVRRSRPCSSAILKRSVLLPPSCVAARLGLHRAAAGVGLHAPAAPARAARAAALDRPCGRSRPRRRGPATACRRARSRRRPPCPRRRRSATGTGWPAPSRASASVATWTSLPSRTPVSSASESRCASGKGCFQSGRLLAFGERAACSRRSSPAPRRRRRPAASVFDAGLLSRLQHRLDHRRDDVLGPAARRRRAPRVAVNLALGVDDGGLDLRPAEVDPADQAGRRRPRRRCRRPRRRAATDASIASALVVPHHRDQTLYCALIGSQAWQPPTQTPRSAPPPTPRPSSSPTG